MSKVLARTNFRVEVTPRDAGDFGCMFIGGRERDEKESLSVCEDIANDIRRHVDNLPSRGNRGVEVIWDSAPVCEHCGYEWTEDSDEYNGGCCDKDEAKNPNQEPA